MDSFDSIEETLGWMIRPTSQTPRRNLKCLGRRRRAMKRVFDVTGAAGLLVVLSPVLVIAAAVTKLTSPGPVIFKQERVGLNRRLGDRRERRVDGPELLERRGRDRRQNKGHGRTFTLYKFRSMTADAEKNGAQFATKGDMRVTPWGRFMRKTRIDELPQLWNVLKGEMSLVGPRPERPVFVGDFVERIPGYSIRLGLKPGLTGLAQVENGYDSEFEDFQRKAEYDRIYLERCCLRNDLKIVARTVKVVLTGKGAL